MAERYPSTLSCILMAGMLLSAFAAVPPGIEAPKISVANIEPKDFTLFEQHFNVQLQIQNPNEKKLTMNGMRFEVDLNEKAFADGMTGETVTIPRFGSQVVNVEVITGITSFLRQFQGLNKTGSGGKMTYRIKGTAFVESPGTFKLPFDEKGEIELGVDQELGEPQERER